MGNNVALVCIAKNEDNYIQEWVEYHKKLGFDTIFIYQNDWVCNLEDNSIVKIELNGECKQTVAYNNFIKEFRILYKYRKAAISLKKELEDRLGRLSPLEILKRVSEEATYVNTSLKYRAFQKPIKII